MLANANLLEIAEVRKIDNGHVAGQTTITPTSIKMDGYDGIAVIVDLGTVTDGCVLNLKLQEGSASNGSDAADLKDPAGNVIGTGNITAATNSNQLLMTDVARPAKEYVTVVFARGTQNAVINTMLAILYRAKQLPVTQGTTVIKSVVAPGT